MTQTPTLLPPNIQPERDPLARIAVSAAPVVLEGRYRLLVRALWQLRHSRRTRWGVGIGSGAFMLLLAFLAVRHFATTSWPLSHGQPGLLVAAGLLLLLAQALKAFGWARLFTDRERPSPLALVAGNGGAALIGVVLPGRFDDAMRIAVVRRYPGCPAGLRAISLACHARSNRQRRARAARRRRRRLPRSRDRCACRARGRSRSRDRSSRGDRGPATPRRKRTCRALPARPLVEPAHDFALPRNAGVGVRLRLLARPGRGVLHPPRHARSGLFVPTRASVSLRRCRGRSAADRASGRSHSGRRRNRRARRLWCRSIAGTCCLCVRGRSGSFLRSSRPALRRCLAHRAIAPARSDGNLIGATAAVGSSCRNVRCSTTVSRLVGRCASRSWARIAMRRASAGRAGGWTPREVNRTYPTTLMLDIQRRA